MMETQARDLDREMYQNSDSDRYLFSSMRVFDNADDLEMTEVGVETFNEPITAIESSHN